MGAGPIEDQAKAAHNTASVSTADTKPAVNEGPGASEEYFGAEVNTAPPKQVELMSPAEELIKAMHLFIEAQTEFIHHNDLGAMATAQEQYINAQTRYIARNLGKN